MKANCYDVTDVCSTLHSCLVLYGLSKGVHSNRAEFIAATFIAMHSDRIICLFVDNYYPAVIRRALRALNQLPGGDNMT